MLGLQRQGFPKTNAKPTRVLARFPLYRNVAVLDNAQTGSSLGLADERRASSARPARIRSEDPQVINSSSSVLIPRGFQIFLRTSQKGVRGLRDQE